MKSLIAFACLLVVSTAGGACMPPKARDPSGRLLFDERRVPHTPGSPYHCVTFEAKGGSKSQCGIDAAQCGELVRTSESKGLTVTTPCHEVDEVYCLTVEDPGGSLDSTCWATEGDCSASSETSSAYAAIKNVSACRKLDRSFRPPPS